MNIDLDGKIALVTGASRGIGKAIANELGKLGAIVVGTATSQNGADSIAQEFESQGIKGVSKVLNIADSDSIDSLFKDLAESDLMPLILVNNAELRGTT